jgi:hypothetical protein
MKLRRLGFFRELRHGDLDGPSLKDLVQPQADYDVRPVAKYLHTAPVMYTHFGLVQDVLNPAQSYIGPVDIRTDGVWVWPEDLAYYVERYYVVLPLEFLEHVRLRMYHPPTEDEINSAELEL